MSTIVYPSKDAVFGKTGAVAGSWGSVRDASIATTVGNADNRSALSVLEQFSSAVNRYTIGRTVFIFDTSGIDGEVTSATFKIYGYSTTNAGIVGLKYDLNASTGSVSSNFTEEDFDAIYGFVPGDTMGGNVTAYTNVINSWSTSTSSPNEITLNSTALSDMYTQDAFGIIFVGTQYDYANSAPPNTSKKTGMYYVDDTTYKPFITYEGGSSTKLQETPGCNSLIRPSDFNIQRFNVNCLSVQYDRYKGNGSVSPEQVPFIMGIPGPLSLRRGSFNDPTPSVVATGDKK